MKSVLVVLLSLVLLSSAALAEETEATGFWDTLRSKIEKVTPRKKAVVTTAVGGVRGSQSDSAGDLYWKGRSEELEVSEVELTRFTDALSLAESGDGEQAIRQFEAFLVQFPQSLLREDAVLALERLRSGSEPATPVQPPSAGNS